MPTYQGWYTTLLFYIAPLLPLCLYQWSFSLLKYSVVSTVWSV